MATYTFGHHPSVLLSHSWRTALNSAGYLLPHLKPHFTMLDIGCGPGTITVDFCKYVQHVTAVDYSQDIVNQASNLAKDRGVTNVTFSTADIHKLPYSDNFFDVVHVHQVLQHVTDPILALKEMKRVCKPGGIVAAREAYYDGFQWYPETEGLKEWGILYKRVITGEPNAGKMIHAWANKAGFDWKDIDCSIGTWCYHTAEERDFWSRSWSGRMVQSKFAIDAEKLGITKEELQRTADAWKEWGSREDAWCGVPNGEIICRKH